METDRIAMAQIPQVAQVAPATFHAGAVAVWSHVIDALVAGFGSAGEGAPYLQPRADCKGPYVLSPHVQVSVVERLSDTSVSVRWRDATRCRYDDQIWISCRARSGGRCALSGTPIRRHDFVYKPRTRSVVPANANAMILASLVERVPALT
jgi:hypothetical protein